MGWILMNSSIRLNNMHRSGFILIVSAVSTQTPTMVFLLAHRRLAVPVSLQIFTLAEALSKQDIKPTA